MKRNKFSYKAGQFFIFAGPAAILFFAVVIIPFIYGLYLTFTSWDGVSRNKPFVGFNNYKEAFADTAYWSSLGKTAIYSVISVILVNMVAFLLAYLVTSGIKGQNFFRAGFFIPNLIGGIVLGYVWKFVFNHAFVTIGDFITGHTTASLLSSANGALFALILVSVWQYAGYMMLIYVAGFMSVDRSLKEAAMIDGCNKWRTFWTIVLPLMKPMIATVTVIDAMAFWNDYLLPSLVLGRTDLYTIPIATQMFYGTYSTDTGLVMAALLLAMLPILILYLFLQRFIVEGVTSGAVKG